MLNRKSRNNINIKRQRNGTILSSPDKGIMVTVTFLLVIGGMAIFSASSAKAISLGLSPTYFILRQFAYTIAGVFCLIWLSNYDYKQLSKHSITFAWVVVGLLLLIYIPGIGVNTNEASRWLALGPVQFQPSELAKPAVILLLANAFSQDAKIFVQEKMKYYLPIMVMIICIYKQPNLSMLLLLFGSGTVMYFCACMDWKKLATVISVAILAIVSTMHGYQKTRLTTWLDPMADQLGKVYNIIQSLIAFSSSGFFGVGYGNSIQKLGWLPECHTDFIYAIIAEEMGFITCILIIGLFWTLIQRGIIISSRCPDIFGKLVAIGIAFSIGIQAFINMGVTCGLLPATGVPLPFISYGGTSIIVSLSMIGILLNISKKRIKKISRYDN